MNLYASVSKRSRLTTAPRRGCVYETPFAARGCGSAGGRFPSRVAVLWVVVVLGALSVSSPTAWGIPLPATATVPQHALRFQGLNQFVQVPHTAAFNVSNQLTLEAWVNVTTWGPASMAIVTKGDDVGLVRDGNNNRISFRTRSGNVLHDLITSSNLLTGRWYHVAATYDGSTKRLYLDGQLHASVAYTSQLTTTTIALNFGANAAAANRLLVGQLDTVRFWSIARSGTEIQADFDRDLYGDEKGLLGEWRFDESTGSIAVDSSVAKRDGTLVNLVAADRVAGIAMRPPPPRATGLIAAVRFDGDDRQSIEVDRRYEPEFDAPSTALTLEAWINVAALDAPWQAIVTKGEAWGLTRSNASARLVFRTKSGAVVDDLGTQRDFLSNRWYHVAAVFTGTQKRIYVDGELDASRTYSAALSANDASVVIGGNAETAGRAWHGDLEAVRVWSTGRTEAEIRSTMLQNLRGSETGLLGDWRFDEGSGPVAFDSSFGEREGILVNLPDAEHRVPGLAFTEHAPPEATLPTSALRFTGASGTSRPRVVIASESAFDITRALTLEAWVRVDSFDRPWQSIVTKGDAWGLVRYAETQRLAFRLQNGLAFDEAVGATDLVTNRWYHVVGVFDGTEARLYLDGQLDGAAPRATPLQANDFSVVIGANEEQTDRAFRGTIDSVRVWSSARSGGEIRAFLDRELRGSEAGLQGEWRFNESSGLAILDSSARGIGGTLTDISSATARVAGLAFRPPADGDLALSFDQGGATKQSVTLASESSFDFPNAFTVEAWVYFDDLPAATVGLVAKGAGAWSLRLRPSGKLEFFTAGLSDATVSPVTVLLSSGAVPAKEWTHVAVSWNPVTGAKSIFLNGRLDEARTGVTGSLGQNDFPVLIGAEPTGAATAASHLHGRLEEVRAWNSARSPDQVLAGYNRRLSGTELHLVGVWSFNEGSGSTVFDGRGWSGIAGTFSVGMGNLNRVEGLSFGPPSAPQYALNFNGVDEYVEIPHSTALDLGSSASFEAWIRPAGGGWRTILAKGPAGYGLALDEQNRLRFYVDGVPANALASDVSVANGVWQHVAVVVDAAVPSTRFYIDGRLVGVRGSAFVANNTSPLWLGRRNSSPPGDYFSGQMDEVRLWVGARSGAEIEFLAFRSPPAQSSGLRAYWGFNEARGIVLPDVTTTRANGSLVNMDDTNWTDGNLWAAAAVDSDLVLRTDPSARGLWLGVVTLTHVNEVNRAINGASELVTPTSDTAQMRVLLHVAADGRVRMLKEVVLMQALTDPKDPNSARREVLVTDPGRLGQFQGIIERGGKRVAIRHGTVAFDFPGLDLPLVGGVGPGVGCAGSLDLAAGAPSNPFRHRYHPDHQEGYAIGRQFSLQFAGASGDPQVEGPNYGVHRLTGTYKETLTGLHKIPLRVQGNIRLDRISTVAVLNDGQF